MIRRWATNVFLVVVFAAAVLTVGWALLILLSEEL